MRRAATAKPPTAPPMMAPVGFGSEGLRGAVGVDDGEVVGFVGESDVLVVVVVVGVDGLVVFIEYEGLDVGTVNLKAEFPHPCSVKTISEV